MAAPTAAPVNAISEIGVSRTRKGPNSFSKPSEVLKGPSAAATSSPMSITDGSARISSARAVAIAARTLITGMTLLQYFFYARSCWQC